MKLTKKLIAGLAALTAIALLAGCTNDYSIIEYENGKSWDEEKTLGELGLTTKTMNVAKLNSDGFFSSGSSNTTTSDYVQIKYGSNREFYFPVIGGATVSLKVTQGSDTNPRYFALVDAAATKLEFKNNAFNVTGATLLVGSDTGAKKGETTSVTLTVPNTHTGDVYIVATNDVRITSCVVTTKVAVEPRF